MDELPPDQRAALSLLLGQRRSYADVAALLAIRESAVHDRAHAALALLAPGPARALTPAQRAAVGDYLLGQQHAAAERLRTRTLLAESAPAAAWARALASELAPLGEPAEIPAEPEPAEEDPQIAATTPASTAATVGAASPPAPGAPPAGGPAGASAHQADDGEGTGEQAPSSRLGGALLLAAIAAAVLVVVLVMSGGGGSHKRAGTGAGAAGTGASGTSTSTSSGPTISARLVLRPRSPSAAIAAVDILSEGSKRAFYLVATHLPATSGFYYALWLYNSPTSSEPLSKSPPVGSNHKLEGGSLLPSNAAEYHQMLLTRETASRPARPGTVILSGRFSVSG